MPSKFSRCDVSIPSHGEMLSCWLLTPGSTAARHPGLVLAHGLGGVEEMRLDAYATYFASQGFACLVFDYRHWGGSSGLPRNLVEPARQLEDWDAALAWFERRDEVDPLRIGIFGTSFGGANVVQVAGRDPRVKAVVSQCPFTDGWASAFTPGWTVVPRLLFWAILDTLVSVVGLTIGVLYTALMNAPDVLPGVRALLCPGRAASSVRAPILFAVCGRDSVAPPGPTLKWASTAPRAEIQYYGQVDHFQIDVGEAFERASGDDLRFYREHLGAVE